MTALHQAAQKAVEALSDDQIDALWLHRTDIHGGELMPQLRDFARAVMALQQQPEPVAPNEWAAEAATVMAQFIHLSAQPEHDAWAQNASRAIGLLNAPALQEVPREPDLACVCGAVWERGANEWEMVHSPRAASPSTTQQQEAGRLTPHQLWRERAIWLLDALTDATRELTDNGELDAMLAHLDKHPSLPAAPSTPAREEALRLAGAAGLDPDPEVVGGSPLGPGEDEYLSWVKLMERNAGVNAPGEGQQ